LSCLAFCSFSLNKRSDFVGDLPVKLYRLRFRTALLCGCVWFVLVTTWAGAQSAKPTTTVLVANPASSIAYQSPVKLIATVTDGAGNPVKLGTVTFYDGNAILGTVHLVGNGNNGLALGTATLWTRLLTVGDHSLSAHYSGITADSPSSSAEQHFTVTAAASPYPSATLLTSTGNTNGQYGFTATVVGFGPASLTGNVTVTDTTTGNVLGTQALSGTSTVLYGSNTIANSSSGVIASGDFNNDGIQDLVVSVGSATLQTLLGNGDGTFAAGQTMPYAGGKLVVADFNGDGNLDVYDGSTVYLGNGDGSFQGLNASGGLVPNLRNNFIEGYTVAVGDLNGDGIPDLVAAGCENSGSCFAVFFGNGGGTFSDGGYFWLPVDTPTSGFGRPTLAVGDLNHDGKDDVVVNFGTALWVFISSGNASQPIVSHYDNGDSFSSCIPGYGGSEEPFSGQGATSVALADLNGDGNLDAIIGSGAFNNQFAPYYPCSAGSYSSQIGVLLGDGNGGFSGSAVYPLGTQADYVGVAVGNFNHDGKLDVIAYTDTPNPSSPWFFLPGKGEGVLADAVEMDQSFSGTAGLPGDFSPSDLIKSDILNDGSDELILSGPTLLQPASAASLLLSNVTVPGQGAQLVTASYPGDSNYAASTSAPVTINVAAPPTFSIAPGTYTSMQTVTISDSWPGAVIYYTTNGTTPTTSSTLYSGPITVSSTETIQAIATASGYSSSLVATAAYTINLPAAATPTFSVVPGIYTSVQTVAISVSMPGAAIYYTTNGTTPTTNSTPYSGPITVSATETLQAIAIASGYSPSSVAAAAYTINPSTTTLVTNPASSTAFQHPVQLIATVKDGAGNPVTLGTVNFYDGQSILGTVGLVRNGYNGLTVGSATLWTQSLTEGAHSLSARYNGTAADAPSSSVAQSFTVTAPAGPYASMTMLTSTGNTNGQYGLTASVVGLGPASLGGNVTVTDTTAGTVLGTNALIPTSTGSWGWNTSTDLCPQTVVSGDFNNDGIQDFVVASNACDGGAMLQTLLGNGDGTFAAGPIMPYSGGKPLVADFNGDGNLDIYDGNGNIYLGNGDGSFQPQSGGQVPPGALVGDINGDGIPDLVTAADDGSNLTTGVDHRHVTVFLGNGDGTFNAGTDIAFGVDLSQLPGYSVTYCQQPGCTDPPTSTYGTAPPISFAVGDLNHDGKDEIVVNSGMGVQVLSMGGTTGLSIDSGDQPPEYSFDGRVYSILDSQYVTSIALADLNGDGNLDVIVGSTGFAADPNQVSINLANRKGGFSSTVYPNYGDVVGYGVSTDLSGLLAGNYIVGDFTNDGITDLIVNSGSGTYLLAGDGSGGLGWPILFDHSVQAPLGYVDLLNDGMRDPVFPLGLNGLTITHPASVASTSLSNVTVPGQGPQRVTAAYTGDWNYATSTSKPVTLDTRTPVNVSLIDASSSTASVFAGYPVTITAAVAVPTGSAAPAGTIQFYNGTTSLGSPIPLSGASANYSLTFNTAGLQHLTATYSGDSNYQTANSPVLNINVVKQAPPTLALTPTSGIQTYGAPVAITAIVQQTIPGPSPTGTVSLTFDGNLVGQGALSGTAPFSVPFTWNPSTPPAVGSHTVKASYSGDGSWSATSTPVSIVVQGTTALSIANSGPATVSAGVPFNITGQLTKAEAGPSPTGTVSLLDNGTPVANSTVSGPALSFMVNTTAQPLSAGTHMFSLKFSPQDVNWQASTSSNLTVTVGAVAAATLSSNLPASLVALPNASIQFTAAVTTTGSTTVPTGTVQFYDGTAQIGAPVPLLHGTAAFTSTVFSVGSHSVTVAYSGDANYAASTSPAIAFTVPAKGTTTVVPSIGGQFLSGTTYQIPVAVQEAPAALGPAPTGTLTLANSSGVTIASGTVTAGGSTATVSLNPLSAGLVLGPNTITAHYLGDSSWNASVSSPTTLNVVMGQPTFSNFTCGSNTNVAAGAVVTCTATFTASLTGSGNNPTPTNPVNLMDNGVVIASQVLVGSTNFAISFQINTTSNPLSAGPHVLGMSFAQDANWLSATSSSAALTVNGNTPTFTLASNLGSFGSVVQGTPITFTATATGTVGVATGTVQFNVDGTPAGTAVPMSSGVATYSTSTLTAASHQITAAYSGDTHYRSTTTNGVVSVVTQGTDTITMAVQGPATINAGTPVTITGSLSVGALGPAPTGTVTLLDGSNALATTSLGGNAPAAQSGNALPSFNFNVNTPSQPLAAGAHTFNVAYSGEAHWVPSASATTPLNVISTPAATPIISPPSGNYNSTQMVTISDTTPGAAIYYTTDGSTPTTSSAKYTAPVTVSSSETIQAVASASGYLTSAVASATYTINLTATATPLFSPAPGTYTSAQTVTISDATSGATIYYTTDGTTPTTASAKYMSPITVSSTETIKAVAVATGYSNSAVASSAYTINLPAATPTFSVAPGTYTSVQTVAISDSTPGAVIYYTTNGSTPTTSSTPYSGPITVSATQTIQAIATANGYSSSAVATAAYSINLTATATPLFSPAAGTYTSVQTITISDATTGATIYYTTDGSTPTTASPKYVGPITVSSTETIRAVATATGYSTSTVISATYTINLPAAMPTFSPGAGTYNSAQTVTIGDTTSGTTISYTTDGSTPTISSPVYSGPITVSSTETIKAIATASGYSTSAVGSATYTINLPATATPTFSPAAGTYTSGQTITISDATTGATIYYTTDGTAPTTASAKYLGPITVSSSETIKAISTAQGYSASSVAIAAYTITAPASTPTFSPGAGTYTSAQTVTISDAITGADIYFTTDGSIPTTSSTKYTMPITVSSSEIINAIAAASGYTTSAVASSTYTISAPPEFSLAASPSSLSVAQGGSGTSIITVAAGGGFAGAVSLSASGLPSGVTASFAPGSAAGTQVIMLTVSSSAQVTSSPLTVNITGTSDSLSATTSVELTITAEPIFTAGSGGTTTMTLASGATTGNTGTISVVGTNGFTGTVNLTCKVTTSISSVTDMPTCTLNPTSVTISGTTVQTTTLTVTTTTSRAENQIRNLFWPSTGGTALAALLFFVVPRGRRNWVTAAGLLLLVASFGTIGCGGGNGTVAGGGSGGNTTTPGAYTITVTGNSGTVSATVGTVTLTVQ
jgi:hypothetical protein